MRPSNALFIWRTSFPVFDCISPFFITLSDRWLWPVFVVFLDFVLQRNLNIYGFTRLTKGPYASGYVHPQFGRDTQDDQLEWIVRDSGRSGGECTPKAKKAKTSYDNHPSHNISSSINNHSLEQQKEVFFPQHERLVNSEGNVARRPGPALRACTSLSSRDNFSTSRVESTGTRTEMRLAKQLMHDKDLMSQVLQFSQSLFFHKLIFFDDGTSITYYCSLYSFRNLRCLSSHQISGRSHIPSTRQALTRWWIQWFLHFVPRKMECSTSYL